MRSITIAALLTMLAMLAGCTSVTTRSALPDRAERIRAAAGAPVNSIRLPEGSMYAWVPLGERGLFIRAQGHRNWLLDLGYCPNLDITTTIRITSATGTVTAGIDKVLSEASRIPCLIQSIRPVDVQQLERAITGHDAGTVVARQNHAPGSGTPG